MGFYYQNQDLYHSKCLDLLTKNCEKHLNLKYSQKNINPQNRWKIWLLGGGSMLFNLNICYLTSKKFFKLL